MDSKSSIYNIHFCRLCQNPKKLDLVPTSDNSQSKNGKSCWDTFKYIFSEIDWVEDRLLSLICRTCLKNTYDCAEFKKQCLETNCQRKQFNNKYIELITEPVDKETDAVDEREQKNANAEPPIEEVILPCTEEIMQEDVFVKTEKVDDIDSRTTNQEASSSVLEPSSSVLEASLSVVRDPVVTKKKIPDNSQRKRKLEANQISRASIKNSKYRIPSTDVRRETSASVPYNVTLISTRLSEFIPVHNPKSFETVCKICQSIFQDPFELRLHIATLHRRKVPRKYRCEFCHIGFSTANEFQIHYQDTQHNSYIPVHCTTCGCKTIRRQITGSMQCHCPNSGKVMEDLPKTVPVKRNGKVIDKQVPCIQCKKTFRNLRIAREHVAREHGPIRTYHCSQCSCIFMGQHFLQHHVNSYHEFNKCVEEVEHNLQPPLHLRKRHTPEVSALDRVVEGCNEKGRSNEENTTKEGSDEVEEMKQTCIVCRKVFHSRVRLINHIESRACDRYGTCYLCGVIFHINKIETHLVLKHGINLREEHFETYFIQSVMKDLRDNQIMRKPVEPTKRCEQYRQCKMCAKYLHVSQAGDHLKYSHFADIEEASDVLAYFSNNLPKELYSDEERVVTSIRSIPLIEQYIEAEHSYCEKL